MVLINLLYFILGILFITYVAPILDALSTLIINKIGVKNAEYVDAINAPEQSTFAIGFAAPSTNEEEEEDE